MIDRKHLKTPKSIATRGEGNKARQASSIGLSIRQRSRRCWRLPLDRGDLFLTPTELFCVRSLSPAPKLELTSYGLQIQGRLTRITYSMR